MKSRITATFLLTVLTSILEGGIGGWLGRGMFRERPAAEASTGSTPAKLSSPSAAPTNPSEAQRLRSAYVAQSNLTAKQLLQQVIDKSVSPEKEELMRARFGAAVTSCDEAAVAEMIGTVVSNVKPLDSFDGQDKMLVSCTQSLIWRMRAFNPQRALELLIRLVKAEMHELELDAAAVLDVLSESELTQAKELMKPWLGTYSLNSMEFALMQARLKFDVEGVYLDLMNRKLPLGGPSDFDEGMVLFCMRDIITSLGQESHEKAIRVLSRIPKYEHSDIFYNTLGSWTRSQPEAVEKWVKERNQAEIISTWLGHALLARQDVDLKWLCDNYSKIKANSTDARVKLAEAVAWSLADKDVERSLRWTSTLPAEEQAVANFQIFPTWLEKDSAAASAWLATTPSGEAKDKAIETLVDNISEEDPEASLKWAGSLQTERRFKLMNETLKKWSAKDPAAAERARQSLPEADRAALGYWKTSED